MVLLLAIVVVAATTLTGAEPATSAEQARAAKLSKLPVYWKVHTGDSYVSIAQKTGLTVAELETFNPRVDPATIRPGQRLKLRLKVPKAKPKPLGPRFHTVRTGETYRLDRRKTGHSMTACSTSTPSSRRPRCSRATASACAGSARCRYAAPAGRPPRGRRCCVALRSAM